MKTLIGLTLLAVITISALNIFGVEDSLTHMIVLGRVPGTDIQLGLAAILSLLALFTPVIVAWIINFNDQLTASKLGSIRKEAIANYEAQIVETKLETVQQIAQQLDVDELDIISL